MFSAVARIHFWGSFWVPTVSLLGVAVAEIYCDVEKIDFLGFFWFQLCSF
jgi:hypothetical protein